MARVVTITARYPRDADTIFAEACHFDEMVEAMRGIGRYEGLPSGRVEAGETYVVDITLFGLFRNPGHRMEVLRLDPAARVIESRESNRSVTRWDHLLTVAPDADGGGCIWTDRIIVEAPRAEAMTALFARFVYTRRHKHRGAASITRSIRPLATP